MTDAWEGGEAGDEAGLVSTDSTAVRQAAGLGSTPGSRSISFFVAGTPVTQGSKKAFVVKGRAVIVDDTDRELKNWRGAVASEARRQGGFIDGPVMLRCMFRLRKPPSRPRRDVVPRGRRNDLDKLVRAVMDALTSVLITDDGDVVYIAAGKLWASPDSPTGVEIRVTEFTP